MLRFLLVGALVALGVPGLAWAGETELRTAVVPSAETVVRVHPRVALAAGIQLRWVASDPTGTSDPVGAQAEGGLRFFVHPILSMNLDYRYGHGRFPVEGVFDREHRSTLGLRLATPGRRFMLADRVRVDLRGVRQEGDWGFRLRLRNEVAATGIFRPWLQLSLVAEGLAQPQEGVVDMLQVRAGVVLHGQIGKANSDRSGRPPPSVQWLVANQVAMHPIAMARARAATAVGAEPEEPTAGSTGSTVDMVVTVGLSGVF